MGAKLIHIFRNTPIGRESLLQSAYFCKQADATPVVYIPRHTKFLMYFENDVVQVDLDSSYLKAPDSAESRAAELLFEQGMEADFFKPKNFTASTLPDIPTHFDFMCCPRTISDLSAKIGLGYIGPRVRRILNEAYFPVLLTSGVYKPWKRIAVLFGGSANALNALKLGLRLRRTSGLPLEMYTHREGKSEEDYRSIMRKAHLEDDFERHGDGWHFFEDGPIEESLYEIPHDALVVAGAFRHGLIKDMVFGSTVEKIQSVLPNNLLVVGPKYTASI
ncbi:MAG: universal stress protein [Thermodesulfobacteriota bacterium]